MSRLDRIYDWLRFQGWRNAYWREDSNHARCPHETPPWLIETEPSYHVCPDCGASVSTFVTVTGSQNTTYRYVSRGRWHP